MQCIYGLKQVSYLMLLFCCVLSLQDIQATAAEACWAGHLGCLTKRVLRACKEDRSQQVAQVA